MSTITEFEFHSIIISYFRYCDKYLNICRFNPQQSSTEISATSLCIAGNRSASVKHREFFIIPFHLKRSFLWSLGKGNMGAVT